LSLDPANDPHGALFHLDFLAVKTGMGQWLLDISDLYSTRRSKPQTEDAQHILALRTAGKSKVVFEQHTSSSVNSLAYCRILPQVQLAALIEAIRDFPSVVPLLADKLDVSLPNTIRSHRDFKIETDEK
jgi:hypothetical protein